jgi:hypothetical protein
MPRFVLLYHECPTGYVRPSHWDLMLEAGDVLETWALAALPRDWHPAHAQTVVRYPTCPPLASGNTVSAEHLAAHRLAYLDYDGPISGGRGEVVRVAAGTYIQLSHGDEVWDVSLDDGGPTSVGAFTLQSTGPDSIVWQLTSRQEPRSGEIA